MWRGPPPPEISQNLGFNPNVGGLWKRRRDTPKNQMNQIKKILSKGINSFEQKKENINKVESLVEQGLIKKEILEEMQEYIVIKESMQKLANIELKEIDEQIFMLLQYGEWDGVRQQRTREGVMEALLNPVKEVKNKIKEYDRYFGKHSDGSQKFSPVELKNYKEAKFVIGEGQLRTYSDSPNWGSLGERGSVLQTYSDNPLRDHKKEWWKILGGAKKKKSAKNKSVKKVKSSKQKRSRKKQK
jgi:hypothetical protein